jgi:hypothetical protein
MSCDAWLEDFFSKLGGTDDSVAPPPRTPAERDAAFEAAQRELARLGVDKPKPRP